jgi:hypothetical protein
MSRLLVVLVCAAAIATAALPATASAAPSTKGSIAGQSTFGISSGAQSSAIAANSKDVECYPWTGINEPCIAVFVMSPGKAVGIAKFSNGSLASYDWKCVPQPPYDDCVDRAVATPPFDEYVVYIYLSGPNIRDVELI